jgi:hypothetical protein
MNNKRNKYLETTIPFSGLYESFHSDNIERKFVYGDLSEEEQDKQRDGIDWKKERLLYCKAYVEAFNECFGFNLKFKDMSSPAYYNYTTDRIFVKIRREDYEKLKAEIDDIAMEEYVKDRFTSYDGFSSHYSNCWDDWLDQKEEFDHNQIGSLIACFVRTKFGGKYGNDWEEELYYSIEY